MVPALQAAVAAPHGLLVATGHQLSVLTGIVELYAAIEALQVKDLTDTWQSVPGSADAPACRAGSGHLCTAHEQRALHARMHHILTVKWCCGFSSPDPHRRPECAQANSAEARRVLSVLDDLVVAQVLSPLQRAVLVVESVPAAPDTMALVDAIAGMHSEPPILLCLLYIFSNAHMLLGQFDYVDVLYRQRGSTSPA